MKVVELNSNNINLLWKGHLSCGHCNSILEVEYTDLKTTLLLSKERGRNLYDQLWFSCAVCHTPNYIPQERFTPDTLKKLAKQTRHNNPDYGIVYATWKDFNSELPFGEETSMLEEAESSLDALLPLKKRLNDNYSKDEDMK